MALESDLFKDNQKLKDCEKQDVSHIVADEPPKRRGANNQGTHVALIHQALKELISGVDFGGEEAKQVYGPKTAEVVRQFKLGPPMILNAALGQTTPDNIVGKQTIKALDRALVRKKGKEIPDLPIPPIQPFGGFTVVPFNETSPFQIIKQPHELTEDDLEADKRQPRNLNQLNRDEQQKLGAARTMGQFACRKIMKFELENFAGALGARMAEKFFANSGVQNIPFGPSDPLTVQITKSPTWLARVTELVQEVTVVLKRGIKERNTVDYHDLEVGKKAVSLELPSFPLNERPLKGTIGGMKGADVFLTKFDATQDPRRWTGRLKFVLFDHFGINDSDLIFKGGHGTQGQHCMWVLQHEHHPGNFPFVSVFTFEMDVADNL
jgi:hypothetical protein